MRRIGSGEPIVANGFGRDYREIKFN